jgi:hypothetical protein
LSHDRASAPLRSLALSSILSSALLVAGQAVTFPTTVVVFGPDQAR